MSLVMIKCPLTGRAVSTAIETEASSFRRLPKVTAHALSSLRAQSRMDSQFRLAFRRAAPCGPEPGSKNGSRLRLARFAEPHGCFEIDRHELRHAAFGHGDAVQPVHARHGDRVVRDDHEARVG
jgi:hypothetical protein